RRVLFRSARAHLTHAYRHGIDPGKINLTHFSTSPNHFSKPQLSYMITKRQRSPHGLGNRILRESRGRTGKTAAQDSGQNDSTDGIDGETWGEPWGATHQIPKKDLELANERLKEVKKS